MHIHVSRKLIHGCNEWRLQEDLEKQMKLGGVKPYLDKIEETVALILGYEENTKRHKLRQMKFKNRSYNNNNNKNYGNFNKDNNNDKGGNNNENDNPSNTLVYAISENE